MDEAPQLEVFDLFPNLSTALQLTIEKYKNP
jgi:hypothetical protein